MRLGFVPRRKDATHKGGAFFLAGRLAANAGQGAGTLKVLTGGIAAPLPEVTLVSSDFVSVRVLQNKNV